MRITFKLYLISLILTCLTYYKGWTQSSGSLVINELMINPNNVASLPAFEFIELYNNSSSTVDLKSITLHVNNNQVTLPSYKIAPSQYVILCAAESEALFTRYGNALALPRWYALNNSGATIKLTQGDNILDEITYSDSWYNSTTKRNDGWSLERISSNWNCNIKLNWSATNSLSGGTPGKNNTILDNKFIPQPSISSYKIVQNRVELNLSIEHKYFSNISSATFTLDEGIGNAEKVELVNEQIVLSLSKNLNPQKLYTLRIEGLKICNLVLPIFETKLFDQKVIKTSDIIINEILFNPKEGGVDFVELYNQTEFPINLQNFKLGNRVITNQFFLLEAKQYLVITTSKKIIAQHYPNAIQENIFEKASLPPYTNQRGVVTLFSNQNIFIDSVYYSADMYSKHVIDPKGISLERTNNAENAFHSASTVYGGATPGYQNSTMELNIPQNKIYLTSNTFSPNDDGYEDELEINYELIHPNYIIAVEIYNEKGQLVKKIPHHNLAGTHGKINWDGKTDAPQRSARGHYISFAQIFDHNGKTQNFKQPFVLISSLTRH